MRHRIIISRLGTVPIALVIALTFTPVSGIAQTCEDLSENLHDKLQVYAKKRFQKDLTAHGRNLVNDYRREFDDETLLAADLVSEDRYERQKQAARQAESDYLRAKHQWSENCPNNQ